MKKLVLYFLLFIFLILVVFLSYFAFFGLKTKSFNNIIENKITTFNKNLDVEIDYIKLNLNLQKLSIQAKTLDPKIIFNNTDVEIESIQTLISIKSFLKRDFALKNLKISSKSIKIKKIINLIKTINKSPQIYILQNKIQKGYLIADLKINFDVNGNINDNFEVNGYVKNGQIDLLGENNLNNVDFLFKIKNNKYTLNDIKFSLNELNFFSEKVILTKNKENIHVKGNLQNKVLELNDEKISRIKNLHPIVYKIGKINFSSKNNFSFKINNKFKTSELFLETKIELENLSFKNEKKGRYFFPEINNKIFFKDHDIQIKFQDDTYFIEGSGGVLLQKKIDEVKYSFNNQNKLYQFKTSLKINQNPFYLDFLNYKKLKQSSAILKAEVLIDSNKEINLKSIEVNENDNTIMFKGVFLDKYFKIVKIDNFNLDFLDSADKENKIKLSRKKDTYNIIGTKLNAESLISKFTDSNDNKKNLFKKNFDLNLQIDQVYLDKKNYLNNLKGNLSMIDNKVHTADISSFFLDNKKFIFSVVSKNNEKVTTLFSERAEPLVRRYKFIKGFEEGTLDFSSKEVNNKSTSKLNIFDFKLQKLPVLTKLLTLASLQGIADTLTGEGIRFNELEMNFTNDGNTMVIEELYAIGPAISILMNGYIEKNKLVSLRGTLVPATTLNKTIGSIPLLGKILVGSKVGEGVFGVSFKIKGHPDNLDTKVNPIKTLTPRFITRTLEKIKKN